MTALYPNGGRIHYETPALFGASLTYPFHRVTPVDDGGNLEHLILLTIYLGVIHIFIGLAIGFRDILLYGNGHGGFGLVCAFFEKGTWMLLLLGGFFFSYGYIGPGSTDMMNSGAAITGSSVLMLMWTLYRYHGVPFPINIGLAPIEAAVDQLLGPDPQSEDIELLALAPVLTGLSLPHLLDRTVQAS